MPKLVLPTGLTENNFASNQTLDSFFSSVEGVVNALDDDNISPSAEIDAQKIGNGGAVTQGEVTLTGEANKIPKFDANGNIVLTRIIFQDGF